MSCYQFRCLQSSLFSLSELKAKSENEQMSVVKEFNNCLTWFELRDFIWDLKLVFPFRCWLGNKWQQPCTVLLSLQTRGSSSRNLCIAGGTSSYCADFGMRFVFWMCSYIPVEAFFPASVSGSHTLQLVSCWESSMRQLVTSNSRARPRLFFSKVFAHYASY